MWFAKEPYALGHCGLKKATKLGVRGSMSWQRVAICEEGRSRGVLEADVGTAQGESHVVAVPVITMR